VRTKKIAELGISGSLGACRRVAHRFCFGRDAAKSISIIAYDAGNGLSTRPISKRKPEYAVLGAGMTSPMIRVMGSIVLLVFIVRCCLFPGVES
jgi:hypothetical protein